MRGSSGKFIYIHGKLEEYLHQRGWRGFFLVVLRLLTANQFAFLYGHGAAKPVAVFIVPQSIHHYTHGHALRLILTFTSPLPVSQLFSENHNVTFDC
jgi:hypothetical protein